MLPRNLENDQRQSSLNWDDLTNGIPTIMALARLCSDQLSCNPLTKTDLPDYSLSDEARAILYCAKETGSISIRGNKAAFEPGQRFLAICVEREEGHRIEFRCDGNPEQTIRFVEGFRQLCGAGLVMHQLMNDFSLSAQGFDLAKTIDANQIESLVQLGRDTV